MSSRFLWSSPLKKKPCHHLNYSQEYQIFWQLLRILQKLWVSFTELVSLIRSIRLSIVLTVDWRPRLRKWKPSGYLLKCYSPVTKFIEKTSLDVLGCSTFFWLVGSVVSLLLTSILPRASRNKPCMKRSHATCYIQGLNKVPFSCLGQVDFPSRYITFYSHLANGQGIRHVVYDLNH